MALFGHMASSFWHSSLVYIVISLSEELSKVITGGNPCQSWEQSCPRDTIDSFVILAALIFPSLEYFELFKVNSQLSVKSSRHSSLR